MSRSDPCPGLDMEPSIADIHGAPDHSSAPPGPAVLRYRRHFSAPPPRGTGALATEALERSAL